MERDFTPVLTVAAVPHGGGIRFLRLKDQIDVDPRSAEKVWQVLKYCNGYNSLRAISELSGLSFELVSEIVKELCDLDLMCGALEQYRHFHRLSSLPSYFTRDDIQAIWPRMSSPIFSSQKLSEAEIRAACASVFDEGGDFTEWLKVYVLVEEDQEEILAGYYWYDDAKGRLTNFTAEVDKEQLSYCFNQASRPFGSAVQIVLGVDFEKFPRDEANRAYRLSLIEVGCASERIRVHVRYSGLDVFELASMQDEPLRQELELEDTEIHPVMALAFGCISDWVKDELAFKKYALIEELLDDDSAVEQYFSRTFGQSGSFFSATTMYRDGNLCLQFAGATSPVYADAVFKAAVEGYERWRSGQVRTDFFGSVRDINAFTEAPWLHPYAIFPLTNEQIERLGFAKFSEELSISWTLGQTCQGEGIFIPSDIIYYGQRSDKTRIYFGHSSGVAAYTDFAEAKERALTELIERDALMRNWYEHESPNMISYPALPVHARKRSLYWRKQGRRLLVLDLTTEYGRVFEAIIIGREYPYFVSGAAATIGDEVETAINKALQEAENNLLLCLNSPEEYPVLPAQVLTPADHGRLYHFKRYAKKLSWLWSGKMVGEFRSFKPRSAEELARELELITVDLSGPDTELKVVRVFSPRLVQINFGFYSAHYTYPFLKVSPKALKLPHYFA